MNCILFLPFIFAVGAAELKWYGLTAKGEKLPRMVAEAGRFIEKDNQCEPSNDGSKSKFLGARYRRQGDSSLVLLFDKNGFIAGVQSSTRKDKMIAQNNPYYQSETIDGVEYWTQTVYFTDPSLDLICDDGRSTEQFEKSGTATGLWIQKGPDPIKDVVHIPLEEAQKPADWTNGKCVPGKGKHYWYKTPKTSNEFVPYSLIYTEGKLVGFTFAKSSKEKMMSFWYDSPYTSKTMTEIMNPVPEFLKKPPNNFFSTIHVYIREKTYVATSLKC